MTHARGKAALTALVAAHLAIGWQLVRLSRDHLNPDGIGYIEIARHYVEGRVDLAITSYWAPLMSWLLAVAIALGYDPLLAARELILGATLVFAFGVRRLTRELTTGVQASGFGLQAAGQQVAFAAALLLSLTMLPKPVTPDVPLAAAITWYLVLAVRVVHKHAFAPLARRRDVLLVGVVGGVSYLTKSYALPFVVAHIALTAGLRLITRAAAARAALRDALLSMVGVLVVAGPWILLISIQKGQPTFSGVGRFARPWNAAVLVNPEPEEFFDLAAPRPGRLAVWENPDEIPAAWTGNPNEPRSFRNFLDRVSANTGRAWQSFRRADPLGALSIGLMLALMMVVLWMVAEAGAHTRDATQDRAPTGAKVGTKSHFRAEMDVTRLWALASLALYAGGYVLVYVEARYLWPVFGLMIAIGVSSVVDVLSGWRPTRTEPDLNAGPRKYWDPPMGVFWLTAICLIGSLAFGVSREVAYWSEPDGIRVEAMRLRTFGEALRGQPPIASNDWPQGLFISYWSRAPFLGQYDGRDPDAIARELAPFGYAAVLVFDDPGLARRLRADPRFEWVPPPVDDDYFPAAFRLSHH